MCNIISILFKFNFWIEKKIESKPRHERSFLTKVWQNVVKKIDNYILFVLLVMKKKLGMINVEPLIDSVDLPIVSLTSFPSRLSNLWMVIYGMYLQTMKPGRIVVTLTKDEVPGGYDSLPPSLKFFSNKGVEFLFVDANLKPHNKYYHCRQKYADRIVITIDDDMLYYPRTLERLMILHFDYPRFICANRVKVIPDERRKKREYKWWEVRVVNRTPSHSLLALGYAAVLYPPSFNPPLLYDAELIKQLSLGADDLWLKAVEIVNNVKVVSGDYYPCPVTLPTSQVISLQAINNNIETPFNDLYIEQLTRFFKHTDANPLF